MATRDSRFGVALYGDYKQIADDFAGIDAPKLKFNFTLSLKYTGMMNGSYAGDDDPYEISFGIKQITRPAPNLIYEDVNYYNFMTKVATRIDFGVVTVTLFDDRTNKAHTIFKNYMQSISPVTNADREQAPLLHKSGQSTSSLLGPMDNGAENGPIKSIRVNHITDHKGSKVMYDFLNPKIQNVVLDELDMTQSDVSTITFTFIYDSYNITEESGGSLSNPGVGGSQIASVGSFDLESLPADPAAAGQESFDFIGVTGTRQVIEEPLSSTGLPQTVSISQVANVPSLLQRIRDQINIDGIPSQVLIDQLQRMGVDTGGLAGSAVRSVIRRAIGQ